MRGDEQYLNHLRTQRERHVQARREAAQSDSAAGAAILEQQAYINAIDEALKDEQRYFDAELAKPTDEERAEEKRRYEAARAKKDNKGFV